MDDKEFRKLRREDLIEIIYQYQRRDQKLTQENEMLRRQLEDRRIRLQKAGSIADAALALSGVFEAAQKAADLYLKSLQDYQPGSEPQQKAAPAVPEAAEEKPAADAPAGNPKAAEPQKKIQKSPIPADPQKKVQKNPDSAEPQKDSGKKPEAQKPAEGKQEKKASQPAVSEKIPEAAKKPAEAGKLPPKPEKDAAAPKKAGTEPRKAAAVPGKAPKAEPAGKETDEFIASLKEYLGM